MKKAVGHIGMMYGANLICVNKKANNKNEGAMAYPFLLFAF
jgi:hypothetical protein